MERVPLRPGTIKICGLREPEHAAVAAEAGADMIGIIFAPTRRYVPPEAARNVIEAAKSAAQGQLLAVGVFVNTPAIDINRIADIAGLDVIQLSGDEEPGDVAGITRPVIKAIRPHAGATAADISGTMERWSQEVPEVTFLIDGFHPGHFGGTGVRTDWGVAATLATCRPLMLAGGLNPGNVADAIAAVAPTGVDVSTGVEIDGRKDRESIRSFIGNAKSGFSQMPDRR